MARARTALELADSHFIGADFSDLLADDSFFVLDECEDSQLVVFPPANCLDFLPNYLAEILLAEREKRWAAGGPCEAN